MIVCGFRDGDSSVWPQYAREVAYHQVRQETVLSDFRLATSAPSDLLAAPNEPRIALPRESFFRWRSRRFFCASDAVTCGTD